MIFGFKPCTSFIKPCMLATDSIANSLCVFYIYAESGGVGPEFSGMGSNSSDTGASQEDSPIWSLIGFKIGVAAAGACVAMFLLCVVLVCCVCRRARRKQEIDVSNMSPTPVLHRKPQPR